MSSPTFSSMSRGLVLVTGGSGFIGYAVLLRALQQGYVVRAVVRSEETADTIRAAKTMKPYLPGISFCIVPSFHTKGAFDEALKGVDYVVHVAAGLPAPEIDYKDTVQVYERLMRPNLEVLKSFLYAAKAHPKIKRVVLCSSAGAMVPQVWDTTDPERPTVLPIETFSADTPPPQRPATGPFSCVNDAYHVSKALSLQQTFDFIEAENPHFSVINVMPTFTLGRKELAKTEMDYLTSTNGFVLAPLLGASIPYPYITPASVCHVDDVAHVHVAALEPKIKGNQNFGISNNYMEHVKFEDAKEVVKMRFPEAVEKGIFSLSGSAPTSRLPFDATRTEQIFGIKFKKFEDCVEDLVAGFLEVAGQKQ